MTILDAGAAGSSENSRIPLLNIEITKAMALDVVERAVVGFLFAAFACRMLSGWDFSDIKPTIATVLLVASEVLPPTLILIRRHSEAQSDKPLDWCLGFLGTNIALLTIRAQPGHLITQELCSVILLVGFVMQLTSKLTLGRSFGIVAANRGVKIDGPYRFVRHPIYLGYVITHIGFLLGFPSLYNLIIYSLALVIQIARLLREEHLLKQDPRYQEYMKQVPYRLIPKVF